MEDKNTHCVTDELLGVEEGHKLYRKGIVGKKGKKKMEQKGCEAKPSQRKDEVRGMRQRDGEICTEEGKSLHH